MKKLILILIISLVPLISYSESNIGVLVGYNTTRIKTDWEDINSKLKSGFQIGVFLRTGEKFFFQPQLLYASRGGYAEFTSEFWQNVGLQNSSTEVHTGLFQIPLIFGMMLNDNKDFGLNIQAGPVFSLVAKKGISGLEEVIKEENFKDYTFGIQAGIGVDFLSFMVAVRYEYALSDIYEGVFDNYSFSAKSNTFLITVGLKIF